MNSYWYKSCLIVMALLAAIAQVVPDNTMGSQVIQNIQINNVLSDRIDAGQQRGNNLFHSFSEFNINSGRGIYFTNPTNITNIFTRVTGTNAFSVNGANIQEATQLVKISDGRLVLATNASYNLAYTSDLLGEES